MSSGTVLTALSVAQRDNHAQHSLIYFYCLSALCVPLNADTRVEHDAALDSFQLYEL